MNLFQAAHTNMPSIVTTTIPQGQPYSIIGSAGGVEWVVAEGISIGSSVAVSDPAAPLDVITTYTVAAHTVETDWIERTLDAPHGVDSLISSEDGRARMTALWEGDATSSWNPGLSFAQPLARRFPVHHRPLVPGGPSWAFEGRVPLADVRGARRALDTGVVWVAHSHARCVADCPLPRVMLAGVDGSVSEGRPDPESRSYSLTLRELEHGVTGVPVVTWGEARAAGVVWGPGTSFESIRAQIAGA